MAIDLRKGKLMDQAERNERRAVLMAERAAQKERNAQLWREAKPMLGGCGWLLGMTMVAIGTFMAGMIYGFVFVGLLLVVTSITARDKHE